MEQAQLAVIVGFAVSIVLQLLKRVWEDLDCSEAVVKQITAVALAALAVLIAAQWQFDTQVLWQMVVAAITALGTHKALLKQPETMEEV